MARRKSADFDAALKRFRTDASHLRDSARECAQFAIAHFQEHGDLIYADHFVEALRETRTMRVKSFVAWMVKFAPCVLEGGKFKGDSERGKPETTKLAEAYAVDFWNLEVAPEVKAYGVEDLFRQIELVINRFGDETKVHLSPKGQSALRVVKTHMDLAKAEAQTPSSEKKEAA